MQNTLLEFMDNRQGFYRLKKAEEGEGLRVSESNDEN